MDANPSGVDTNAVVFSRGVCRSNLYDLGDDQGILNLSILDGGYVQHRYNQIVSIAAATLAVFVCSTNAHAQDIPITGLPHVSSIQPTDAFIFQRAGATRDNFIYQSELFSGYASLATPAISWAVYAADYGVGVSSSAATNDAGIAAAIAALPASGGTVVLPCGNGISISATITLGNATTTTASTRNGITLTGCGTGPDGINMTAISGATRLVWVGSAGGRMIEIHGPIEGINLSDFTLDGGGLAAQLIHSYRSFQQDVRRMNLIQWTGTAIAIDADGTYTGAGGGGGGGAPFQQTWELVNIINPSSTSANAVTIGSNVNGNYNVNEVTFTRCQLERGNTDNAYSLWLGNVDHATFVHSWFLRRSSTTGKAIIVAPQSGAPTWPSNITFIASPLQGGIYLDQSAATWSNTANPALLFYPFYTADSQAIPPVGAISTTLPATLVGGMTDTGMPLSGSQTRISLSTNQGMSANQEAFGNNGILFEGATSDAFETFLTVTDPTADRTITLPNVSGTVVTTGDTATVTAGMLANALPANTTAVANQFFTAYNSATGAYTKAQPAFTDISGVTTIGQIPTGTTSTTVALGNSKTNGPGGSKYSTDRIPSSNTDAPCTDEFLTATESGTWRWGNQGSSTQALTGDVRQITIGAETTNVHVRWCTPPAATDWTFGAKVSCFASNSANACGLAVLETGTEATPTALSFVLEGNGNGTPVYVTKTSYTSAYAGTAGGPLTWGSLLTAGLTHWQEITYVSSSKTIAYKISLDGIFWFQVNSKVLGANPVSLGTFVDANTASNTGLTGIFYYTRLVKSSNGLIGQ